MMEDYDDNDYGYTPFFTKETRDVAILTKMGSVYTTIVPDVKDESVNILELK
ncbi:hypothetical protein Lqui_2672 [Legionella quinlivanii]|uniref:Uncharacterized protein n=1 Tax=Legionella quinlivanii TaxID=45073 RepID=A0A0W0XKK5_9GAMM|nr:hypothetical protein [Legionella quinlivanii]KTD45201.1 hypothetical protein Lqui_2672 [Legionella quinlivanii]MCW8450324.1 hypothetical protein [Legionella quinlivanii]SEG05321.1 hypothetical protein SAMN02746093_01754 [Legionella quinlivanii DSM 21216]STY11500.1 Uncharacterised protein [Legionella quinlivanii]